MRNALGAVYVAIAVATFSHTTWSAALTFQGNMPEELWPRLWWLAQGGLLAVAIDVGMLVAARQLAVRRTWVMVLAFILAALASGYTQVIYAVHHAAAFDFGEGVTPAWQARLQTLIDARIVVLPLALPAFAIIYTVAGHHQDHLVERNRMLQEEVQRLREQVARWSPEYERFPIDVLERSFYSEHTGKLYGPYQSREQLELQIKSHNAKNGGKDVRTGQD